MLSIYSYIHYQDLQPPDDKCFKFCATFDGNLPKFEHVTISNGTGTSSTSSMQIELTIYIWSGYGVTKLWSPLWKPTWCYSIFS